MKQLKKKSLKSILPLLILFWGIAAFGLYSGISGLITNYITEPTPMESVDFSGDIEGLYVSGPVYVIYDWYCEEYEGSKTTAREYIIDADEQYYICLLADNASEMADANKLMEATYAYYDGEDDGTLIYESQYEIKGTIKKIPSESLDYLHEFIGWNEMDSATRATFLPYYIDVNNLGSGEMDSVIAATVVGVLFLVIGLVFFIMWLKGSYQKSIKKYIESSASPDMAKERVEYFLANTEEINGLRYNRDFICGNQNGTIAFGEMSKLCWVYLHTTTHKRYFITVGKSYALMLGFTDGSIQAAGMKNEKIARDHMQQLSAICPQVVFGYSDDLEKMFRKDMSGFLNLRYNQAQANNTGFETAEELNQ